MPLGYVLRPSGSTPDPADHRIPFMVLWSLMSSGHAVGFTAAAGAAAPSPSTNDGIARHSLLQPAAKRAACHTILGFAGQLEAEGQWPWAVCVLQRAALAAPQGPGRAANGVVPRAVGSIADEDSERSAQESRYAWIKDAREVVDRCVPDRFLKPKLFSSVRGMLEQPVLRGKQDVPLAASLPRAWLPLAAARRLVATRSGL